MRKSKFNKLSRGMVCQIAAQAKQAATTLRTINADSSIHPKSRFDNPAGELDQGLDDIVTAYYMWIKTLEEYFDVEDLY